MWSFTNIKRNLSNYIPMRCGHLHLTLQLRAILRPCLLVFLSPPPQPGPLGLHRAGEPEPLARGAPAHFPGLSGAQRRSSPWLLQEQFTLK